MRGLPHSREGAGGGVGGSSSVIHCSGAMLSKVTDLERKRELGAAPAHLQATDPQAARSNALCRAAWQVLRSQKGRCEPAPQRSPALQLH